MGGEIKREPNSKASTFREKRQEKLRQTSFKTHHLRAQPIRTQKIPITSENFINKDE